MWFRKGLFRSPVIMLFYLTVWSLRLWVTTVGVHIVFYFDPLSVLFEQASFALRLHGAVKPAYRGSARNRNFFSCWKVQFDTGTLSMVHRDCKLFPLKTSFRYVVSMFV